MCKYIIRKKAQYPCNNSFNRMVNLRTWGGGGGGGSHMEGAGMLVVSLRGANFEVWSHLGCFEQDATKFSHQGLV